MIEPPLTERRKIKRFFLEYGTHFQKDVYMGASFLAETRFYAASSSATDIKQQINCSQTAFEASLKASANIPVEDIVVGLGGEETFKTKSEGCSSQVTMEKCRSLTIMNLGKFYFFLNIYSFYLYCFSAAKVVSYGLWFPSCKKY